MSKNIRQSVKIKGAHRSISLFPPQSDKRKARKLRRKVGKVMALKLQHIPDPQPLYINLDEEIERGNIDIGHLTWDRHADEIPDRVKILNRPSVDLGLGWSIIIRKPEDQ